MKKWQLGSLFLNLIDKFFISLTFLDEFALPPTNFNMNFWTPFTLIANKITHLLTPLSNE